MISVDALSPEELPLEELVAGTTDGLLDKPALFV
jgi:hypothetical protein